MIKIDEDISAFHWFAVKGYLMRQHPWHEATVWKPFATYGKKAITRSFSLRVTAVSAGSGVLLLEPTAR